MHTKTKYKINQDVAWIVIQKYVYRREATKKKKSCLFELVITYQIVLNIISV